MAIMFTANKVSDSSAGGLSLLAAADWPYATTHAPLPTTAALPCLSLLRISSFATQPHTRAILIHHLSFFCLKFYETSYVSSHKIWLFQLFPKYRAFCKLISCHCVSS